MKKIIAVLACVAILATSLCACGANGPAKTLAAQLDMLKSGDVQNSSLMKGEGVNTGDAEMIKSMFGRLTYTMGKETITGDTATVEVEITTVDMVTVFTNYFTEALSHATDESWDADESRFYEMIDAEDAPIKTSTAVVAMEKKDGAWVVKEENIEFMDAITGGFYQYLTEISSSLGEQ